MAKMKVIKLGHFSLYKTAFMSINEPFLVSQRKSIQQQTFSGRPM